MRISKVIVGLTACLLLLSLLSSGLGLFWDSEVQEFEFTNVHGKPVEIYGSGLYKYDSQFIGAGLRGTDFVTLFIATPLLLYALFSYQRGSLRGAVLLSGLQSYFLYNAVSLAFGTHYNALLLVYTGMLSLSLTTFVLTIKDILVRNLPEHLNSTFPERSIGSFLIFAGIALCFVWLSDIIPSLLTNQVPKTLAHYTTIITYPIDLGIIAPYVILSGYLLRCRNVWGYLFAAPMLILCALIGIVVLAQTAFQVQAGVPLTLIEIIIYAVSFMTMASVSGYFTFAYFRSFLTEPHSIESIYARQNAQA